MKMQNDLILKSNTSEWGRQGMALGMVLVVVLGVSILGLALMTSANMTALGTSRYLNSTKAFWLADAGAQRFNNRAYQQIWDGFTDSSVGGGTMSVAVFSNNTPPYAECIGVVNGSTQRVQIEYSVQAPSFNYATFAGNASSNNWYFTLRGNGTTNMVNGHLIGGRDLVSGDVFVNGKVALYEQSAVSNAPAPNSYTNNGAIFATSTIALSNSAMAYGGTYPNQTNQPVPNISVMNYASNNSWNVAREFQNAGISSGTLPVGHPLRNIVVKNPSNRASQNNSTTNVDDFYFEPMNASQPSGTTQFQAKTPLDLGKKKVYYVNGHVWFNNLSVYGFAVTGTATIVATRDIHISDNLKYATTNDMLGLIAIGTYDSSGQLADGGNIYFGDPSYGTLFTADAFMFAANNFYYNTSSTDPSLQQEPTTGFQVYGNYAAMNQVRVNRDWYSLFTYTTNGSGSRRVITTTTNDYAAWFDPSTNRWRDVAGNTVLAMGVTNTLRHYQMVLKYDERVHRQDSQPPMLPAMRTGVSGYFDGITKWKLVPY